MYSSAKSPQEKYAYKKKNGKENDLSENQVIQGEKVDSRAGKEEANAYDGGGGF